MRELLSLLDDLERGARAPGSRERGLILDRLGELYAGRRDRIERQENIIFDSLFMLLCDGAETEALQRLSARLSATPNPPARTLNRLAMAIQADVAGPILSSALPVPEATLREVARTESDGHLLALAARPQLTPPVTTPIAQRGGDATVVTLSRNLGARFDEEGFGVMAERARPNGRLRTFLCVRPDTPGHFLADLMPIDFDEAASAFDADFGGPDMPGKRAVEMVIEAILDGERAIYSETMLRVSLQYVAARATARPIAQSDLERWTRRRHVEDAIAALAVLSGLPPQTVYGLVFARSLLPSAILFRALNFSWGVLKGLLRARGADPAASEDASDQRLLVYEIYDSLSANTARLVIRHAGLHRRQLAFADA